MTAQEFAGWMEQKGYKPNGETFEELLKSLENQIARNYVKGMVKAAKIEREECAKAAEAVMPMHTECVNKIAAAIRERGKL